MILNRRYAIKRSRFLSISKSATETTDLMSVVGRKSTKQDMSAAERVRFERI